MATPFPFVCWYIMCDLPQEGTEDPHSRPSPDAEGEVSLSPPSAAACCDGRSSEGRRRAGSHWTPPTTTPATAHLLQACSTKPEGLQLSTPLLSSLLCLCPS
jgi:hypothetical protein